MTSECYTFSSLAQFSTRANECGPSSIILKVKEMGWEDELSLWKETDFWELERLPEVRQTRKLTERRK